MNTIDLLLFEHSVIRLRASEAQRAIPAREAFEDLHALVIRVHARVEDEIVFPKVLQENEGDEGFASYVKRISADHRLIETLGNNIISWYEEGNREMLERRVPLYFKILTEHNANEEREIFHRLKSDLADSSRGIIESFGVERYVKVSGVSEEMLRRYFR